MLCKENNRLIKEWKKICIILYILYIYLYIYVDIIFNSNRKCEVCIFCLLRYVIK